MHRYTLNLLFLLLLLFPPAMVATDRGGPGIFLPQQETVVYYHEIEGRSITGTDAVTYHKARLKSAGQMR